MKSIFSFLNLLTFWICACTPTRYCASNGNYFKSVDTSKPYMIDGKYCLEYAYDTTLRNGMSIISLRVFDRRNGKYAHDCVVWFYNESDTAQLLLGEGSGYKKLPAGDYLIGIAISNAFLVQQVVIPVFLAGLILMLKCLS